MSVLQILWKIVQIILAVVRGRLWSASTGALPPAPPVTPPPVVDTPPNSGEAPSVDPVIPPPPPVPPEGPGHIDPVVPPPPPPSIDYDRKGSFIITDIYPKDLGENPPYHVLPGLKVGDHEMIGCIIKASQGLGWGTTNEAWFKRGWAEIKRVGGERYGKDWFRGAYHFLTFKNDGAKQADYFLKLVEQAGGWDVGDIMPMVDAEEGGQGDWAGGQKLEAVTGAKRIVLRNQVIDCVGAFAERVRSRTGQRVMLYGRGIMRDLGISDRMKCDGVVNPAYTKVMPDMSKYGWPLSDVLLWQLCGDGVVYRPGFPSEIPGWGKEDYSVYVDGANKTDLVSFRRRVLAKSR